MNFHVRIGQPSAFRKPIGIVSYYFLVIPQWKWQLNEFSTLPRKGSRERA